MTTATSGGSGTVFFGSSTASLANCTTPSPAAPHTTGQTGIMGATPATPAAIPPSTPARRARAFLNPRMDEPGQGAGSTTAGMPGSGGTTWQAFRLDFLQASRLEHSRVVTK